VYVLGLQVGDELLVLNGLVISQLDMVYVEALLDELDAISLTVRSCRPVERSACPLLSSPPTSDELTAAADTPSAHVAATWMQHSGSAHQSSRLLLLVLACSTVDDLLFTTRRLGRF